MNRLEKIEREVQALKPEEIARFRSWFAEFDAGHWDAEIEADAGSGRLDTLGERALAAHRAGQTRAL